MIWTDKTIFEDKFCETALSTFSNVDIPDGACKEIEFLFLHEIVSFVEEHKIPPALIINIDQTPLKYVPVGNEILPPRGETSATIKGSANERSLTGIFAISLHGEFLLMQAIYKGKKSKFATICVH